MSRYRIVIALVLTGLFLGVPLRAQAATSFIAPLTHDTVIASTVPANGDVNPYGIAVVPATKGYLVAGDVLVSNFNAASNLQGTGSTIVEISPTGSSRLFAQLPTGVGLTTALVVLQSGWVIVGNMPTTDGTPATIKPGSLIVLDKWGHVAETISGQNVQGPWDATVRDFGVLAFLFYTNVLNGTVVRTLLLNVGDRKPLLLHPTVIGSDFPIRTDPAALVVGPTGVAFNSQGGLYVADTDGNRIALIPNALFRGNSAGTGTTVYADNVHLHGPLGLTIAPNGDLLTVNGDAVNPDPTHPSEMVEATPRGAFVTEKSLDPSAGALFGLAITPDRSGVYFVEDATNTLNLLH